MIKIPTRILLVDDKEDFVEMLSMRLQEAGDKDEQEARIRKAEARLLVRRTGGT